MIKIEHTLFALPFAFLGMLLAERGIPPWRTVLLWVAGFDVLYALQDVEIDRRQGLFSIPARLGVERALWVSALLHLGALLLLALLPRLYAPGLGAAYWLGVAGCAALLAWQHW